MEVADDGVVDPRAGADVEGRDDDFEREGIPRFTRDRLGDRLKDRGRRIGLYNS